MSGFSRPADDLLASQAGLCSTQLVHIKCTWQGKNAYQILVVISEDKTLHGEIMAYTG